MVGGDGQDLEVLWVSIRVVFHPKYNGKQRIESFRNTLLTEQQFKDDCIDPGERCWWFVLGYKSGECEQWLDWRIFWRGLGV